MYKFLSSALAFFGCWLLWAFFAAALAAQTCVQSDSLHANALLEQGRAAGKQGNLDSAVLYYRQAKTIFEQGNCVHGLARASTNLTLSYSRQKNLVAYKTELLYAVGIAEQHLAANDTTAAKIFQIAGTDYFQSKQIDTAIVYLEKSKNIYRSAKSWEACVRVCRTLATVAQGAQNYVLMKKYIDEAYEINKTQLKSQADVEANIQQLYGALYYRTGEYERALQAMERGLVLVKNNLRSRQDTLTLINFYNNVGLLYAEVGDLIRAEEYCINAMTLSVRTGEYYRAAMIYYNLGESFRLRGELEKAYEDYQKGLLVLGRVDAQGTSIEQSGVNIQQVYINLRNGLAEVAPQLQRLDEARQALELNLQTHRSKETYREEETYRILAQYQLKKGDLPAARAAAQRALSINLRLYGESHPLVARSYQQIGSIDQRENRPEQANQSYKQALIALVVRESPKKNPDILPASTELISDKETYLRVLYDQASLLYTMSKRKEAHEIVQYAIQLIDKTRNSIKTEGSKLFVQKQVMPIYELYLKILVDEYEAKPSEKYLAEAFRLMEKSKGLLLLDAIKSEEALNLGELPRELVREDRRLQREIARVEKALFEAQSSRNSKAVSQYQSELLRLREEAQKLQKDLEKNYPKYYELKYKEKIATLDQISQHLNPDAQLIEYFLGSEHAYIFHITQKSRRLYRIPFTRQLESQIATLKTALTTSSLIVENTKAAYYLYTKAAYNVYENFLLPFIDSSKKQLIIIPDGDLYQIPFEALLCAPVDLSADNISYNFKTLPYLLHRYTTHYNYSASLMLFTRHSEKTDGTVLAFAPSYAYVRPDKPTQEEERQAEVRTKVKELPGAAFELEMLESYFKGSFRRGSAANESTLKQLLQTSNYSVLHLAMHGWVNNEQPEYSNLILSYSRDTVEDDFLHAYEINLLDIQTDLVVLSACETGSGKYERGEGVVSIGRGFMHAGAPAIAMTLWSINDQATAILMTFFYERLAQKTPKNSALQLAKIDYIHRADSLTAHPFFWAGFVLLGDEKPIRLKQHLTKGDYIFYGGIALLTLAIVALSVRHYRQRIQLHNHPLK